MGRAGERMTTTRKILEEAVEITGGARAVTYGDKRKNHENIAGLWNAWLKRKLRVGEDLTARDVAVLMGLMKAARMMQGKGTLDSYVDAAAYFAMAGELDSAEAVADKVVIAPGNIKEVGDGYDFYRQLLSMSDGLKNLDKDHSTPGGKV